MPFPEFSAKLISNHQSPKTETFSLLYFMYFSLYLFLFGLPALLLITVAGCSSPPEKTYVNHPETLRKQADLVCQNTDASHFRVENQTVRLKRQGGKELELKHYNSLLPDGYYFCTLQNRKSSILD